MKKIVTLIAVLFVFCAAPVKAGDPDFEKKVLEGLDKLNQTVEGIDTRLKKVEGMLGITPTTTPPATVTTSSYSTTTTTRNGGSRKARLYGFYALPTGVIVDQLTPGWYTVSYPWSYYTYYMYVY